MREILILILCLMPIIVPAQSIEDWELGIAGSAFYFTKIDTGKEIDVGSQEIPNGHFYGLTVAKNWNENWGLSTGLEYSFQNWKARDFFPIQSTGSNVNENLEYLKLPFMLQFTYSPNKDNFYWVLKKGFQISWLTDYYTIIDNRHESFSYTSIYQDGRVNHWEEDHFVTYANNAYKDFLFGIIGSVGIKKIFNENWSYTSDLRYELDFTHADDKIWRSEFSEAKNFRIGLVVGIQYRFHIKPKPYVEGIR